MVSDARFVVLVSIGPAHSLLVLPACRDSCKCYTITLENFQKLPPQAVQAARMMALAEGASPPTPARHALDHTEREIIAVSAPLATHTPLLALTPAVTQKRCMRS